MTIPIAGLDKAEILLNLWGASKEQGISFMGRLDVDLETCRKALSQNAYVDYLGGRVIKCDFSKDTLDPWGFDRDNGEGAAERVIDKMTPKAV